MPEITTHRCEVPGLTGPDFNEHIHVSCDRADKGGAYTGYTVYAEHEGQRKILAQLIFQNQPINCPADINGITNEILLAVVANRLEGFQSGPFACTANQAALHHTKVALGELHGRTRARREQQVEGKYEKHAEPAAAEMRLSVSAVGLHIRQKPDASLLTLTRESLQTWAGWDGVTQFTRPLLPLTPKELAAIATLAESPAGKNGHAEFLQAIKRQA